MNKFNLLLNLKLKFLYFSGLWSAEENVFSSRKYLYSTLYIVL